MRTIAPVARPGMSALFSNTNRNKHSVALDLKTEAGKGRAAQVDPDRDAFCP